MIKLAFEKQTGFTLLEVVIAMAIGAIGIMAFVAVQLKSFDISTGSYERATAAYIASEMVERMSSNTQDENARKVYQGESGGEWLKKPVVSEIDTSELCVPGANPDGTGDPCANPKDLATMDIREMKRLAGALLPNGDISHKMCGTNKDQDCIVVAWNDADINNCQFVSDGTGLEDCFVLQVKLW